MLNNETTTAHNATTFSTSKPSDDTLLVGLTVSQRIQVLCGTPAALYGIWKELTSHSPITLIIYDEANILLESGQMAMHTHSVRNALATQVSSQPTKLYIASYYEPYEHACMKQEMEAVYINDTSLPLRRFEPTYKKLGYLPDVRETAAWRFVNRTLHRQNRKVIIFTRTKTAGIYSTNGGLQATFTCI